MWFACVVRVNGACVCMCVVHLRYMCVVHAWGAYVRACVCDACVCGTCVWCVCVWCVCVLCVCVARVCVHVYIYEHV